MTMTSEPRALREIHEIRLEIYEQTKDLSASERTALIKKEVDELCRTHNFQPKWVSLKN